MGIPKIIVQTHRDASIGLQQKQSWTRLHPAFEHRFVDDDASRAFMQKHFPDLMPTYDKLPFPVQKADLFRYAAIYEHGGVYTDVDTVAIEPIDSYVDMKSEHLVVGMEMTPAQYGRGIDAYVHNYSTPFQILQWTFAASPRHPALAAMLRRIDFLVAQMAAEQLEQWSQAARFTLELTGPMAFTQALLPFMSEDKSGRITVLPRLTWGSIPIEQRMQEIAAQIKVKHLFEGSWRPKNPGKKPGAIAPADETTAAAPIVNYSVRL